MSVEAASHNPDYDFNIAKSDIKLARNTYFAPGQSQYLRTEIGMEDFPTGFFDTHNERPLVDSARSSLAQLALEAQSTTSELITAAGLDAHFAGLDSFETHIYFTNNSKAKIFMGKGTGLLRLYQRPKEYINGGDLDDLIKEGGVYIDGKKKEPNDEDGDWIQMEDGIAVKIQEDWRKFVPEQPEVIKINGHTNGDHGRTQNSLYLEDVSKIRNPFEPGPWFGKSVPIFLNTVAAEIDPSAYPNFREGQPHGHAWPHLRSWILDKVKTQHRVIFELYSPTKGEQVVNWVVMRFGYQE